MIIPEGKAPIFLPIATVEKLHAAEHEYRIERDDIAAYVLNGLVADHSTLVDFILDSWVWSDEAKEGGEQ